MPERRPARAEQRRQLGAPRGVVIDPSFDWEGDEPPRMPLHRSVIYEAHVKGLTKLHPDVPEALRGTYAGSRTRRSSSTCASSASPRSS